MGCEFIKAKIEIELNSLRSQLEWWNTGILEKWVLASGS
jgi:hypothetical protein